MCNFFSLKTTLLALTVIVTATCGISLRGASADDNEARAKNAVGKLFDAGWDTSLSARRGADEIHQLIQKFGLSADDRLAYAYALVLIRQHRYADADKQLEESLSKATDDLHVLKARAWVSILVKKYPNGLARLDDIAALLKTPTTKEEAEAYLWNSAFLGRLFAFLEGPAKEDVAAAVRESQMKKVWNRLNAEGQKAFETAYQEALDRFHALTNTRSEKIAKSEVLAEIGRKEKLAQLEEDGAANEEKQQGLTERRDKLRSEAQDELREIDKREQPLVTELARLDSQASVVRRELTILSTDISRWEARLAGEEDPVLRDRYQREIDRLDFLGRRYQIDLQTLRRQADVVNVQRAQLQRERLAAQANYGGQLQDIDNQLGQSAKDDRKIELQKKRTSREKNKISGEMRVLAAQAGSLPTYQPFPVEEEKQRVLGLFGP